jgi:hypothetical protein
VASTGAKGYFAGNRTATLFSTGLRHKPVLKGHLKSFLKFWLFPPYSILVVK